MKMEWLVDVPVDMFEELVVCVALCLVEETKLFEHFEFHTRNKSLSYKITSGILNSLKSLN